MKKLINRVEDVLNEQLQGLAKAHPQLTLHQDPLYVTRTRRAGGWQGGPALRRRQRT